MSRQKVFTVTRDQSLKKYCVSRKTLKTELINPHFQPKNIQKQQSQTELNNLQGKQKNPSNRIKPSLASEDSQLEKSKARSGYHGNEGNNNPKRDQSKDIFFSASKIFAMAKKQLGLKIADRVNDSKRFLIRRKAKSNYYKKQELSIFEGQFDFQKGGSKKMKEKNIFPIQGNFTDLSIIKEDIAVPFKISQSHHPNAVKVKSAVCRQSKEDNRLMTEVKEEDTLAKENRSQVASMNSIGKMIKKIRRISKCDNDSDQNSKNVSIKKDEQSEGHQKLYSNSTIKKDINKNPSRMQKIKAYNGCKTIRVMWGQNQQYFVKNNEMRQKKVRCESIISNIKDDVFEGFSVLQNKTSYISNVAERVSDPPIESLRELYECFWPNEDEIHREDGILRNNGSFSDL